MALAHLNFFSEVLGLSVQADVILPQKQQGVGQEGAAQEGDVPVLWLLHGGSDDHTIWQRRTSIERYAAPLGMAVVMPAVQLSFYTNMAWGGRYFDYVADELPRIMRGFFHFSSRREDNFVAGLSMGGYGAFKLALSRPGQYAAAASLSGALDIESIVESRINRHQVPGQPSLAQMVFGSPENIKGSEHDLFHLLEQARRHPDGLPRLYVNCGTEDFLYDDNRRFLDFARGLGVDLEYYEEPGIHDWDYWDRNIQRVLAWIRP